MRILLDTNVIVVGLISQKGPPATLIRAWLDGVFELVTAREQLDELIRSHWGVAREGDPEQWGVGVAMGRCARSSRSWV